MPVHCLSVPREYLDFIQRLQHCGKHTSHLPAHLVAPYHNFVQDWTQAEIWTGLGTQSYSEDCRTDGVSHLGLSRSLHSAEIEDR